MKTLVVFYSRTGNTKKIANKITNTIKADIEEIKDTKNRRGILNFFLSGRDALYKKNTTLLETKKDPSKYDLVIIGTPVWASNISTPILTYITDKKFKKVAFFCTSGGTGIKKCFEEMEEICGKPIATLGLSKKELEDNEKLNSFLNKLK